MANDDIDADHIVAHSLRGEGFDASEDGTGRGTPLVPVPILEAGARTGVSTTDLRAGCGIGEAGDPMFTLQSGKQHAAAFAENSRAELRLCGGDGNVSAQLTTGGGKPGQGQPCIAFQSWASASNSMNPGPVAPALDKGKEEGMAVYLSARSPASAVRRLTPIECERLQGFPDGYTLVPDYATRIPKTLEADMLAYHRRHNPGLDEATARRWAAHPDGPRYRALGNSMAVPVMAWIGRRLAAVQALETTE